MKILTTLHDSQRLDDVLKVTDGIIVGDARYAKALTQDFKDDMLNIIGKAHQQQKEVFVLFNKLYTDQELLEVKDCIEKLPVDKITGFIGADIGLVSIFESLNLSSKFVYNPETLLTNDEDFNDLASKGIMGAFVSKEITLEDILEIASLKQYKLFYFGHGHMSMFYSKRHMLDTFSDYQNKPNTLHKDKTLALKEFKRVNETYPVLEDEAGTHVFRGAIFNSFNAIDALKLHVDYFVVDTLFLDDDYAIKIIPMYQKGRLDETILEIYDQVLHDGFLFDESTIKGDKND